MHINCLAAFLEVKCFGKGKTNQSSEDGQHVSLDLHQKARGNDLPKAEQPGQRAASVVHGEEHYPVP
jgi:hypothetical protein